MRGLFVEIASIVALIAGVYGAIHFSHFAAEFLNEQFNWEEQYINLVAFAITFIIIVFLIALAGKALTKLADFAALGIFNRILGAIFGGLKIGLILSIIIMVVDNADGTFQFMDKDTKDTSVLYEPIRLMAPAIFPVLLQAVENLDKEAAEDNE